MNRHEFKEFLYKYVDAKYPYSIVGYEYSNPSFEKFWRLYRNGNDYIQSIDDSLSHISTLKNFKLYWYNIGISDPELLNTYSAGNFNICKVCSKIYNKQEYKHTSCCSDECKHISLQTRNKNLSISRSNYNNRDPAQYALRHNISIDEAKTIISKFVRNGSNLCVEYWINLGYTEEDAKNIISSNQSIRSPRHPKHWIAKGYTEEDATLKVREHQQELSNLRFLKYENLRKFSPFCIEYWVDKGLTYEESKRIISKQQSIRALNQLTKYTEKERREYNVLCLDYWIKLYPDDYIRRYEEFRNSFTSIGNRSGLADKFCNEIASYFPNNKLYYGDREFGRYHPIMGYLKYDYVDLTLNVCIEFNGNYWHGNPLLYNSGDIIKFPDSKNKIVDELWERDFNKCEFMRELGFDVYVVWESDYNSNPDLVKQLVKEIQNEKNS